MAQTLKLQPNVPVTGVATAAYHAPSQRGFSDQVKITGTFDGIGQGAFYLPLGVKDTFVGLGLCDASPSGPKGDSYNLRGRPRIRLLSADIGGGRHHVTVEVIGGAAPQQSYQQPPQQYAPPQQQGYQQPMQQPQQQPYQPPPFVPPSQQQFTPPPVNQHYVAPAAPPQETPQTTVARLVTTLAKCVEAAKAVYENAGYKDVPADVIQSGAATLFIERCKRNLLSPAPKPDVPPPPPVPLISQEQMRQLDELGPRLGMSNVALKAEVCRISGAADAMQLTQQQAASVVAEFERRVGEAARQAAQSDMPPGYTPTGGGGEIPF